MDLIDKIVETLLSGNVKAKVALTGAFLIFLKMLYDLLGLEYLSMTSEEMASGVGTDLLIGEILPIDIGTVMLGVIAIMLANYGLNHGREWIKVGKIAKYGAIIMIILSFTPVPFGLSMITRTVAEAGDAAVEAYRYVAYYFFVEEDGISCSVVMLGICDPAIIDVLEDYMYEAVKHVEFKGT